VRISDIKKHRPLWTWQAKPEASRASLSERTWISLTCAVACRAALKVLSVGATLRQRKDDSVHRTEQLLFNIPLFQVERQRLCDNLKWIYVIELHYRFMRKPRYETWSWKAVVRGWGALMCNLKMIFRISHEKIRYPYTRSSPSESVTSISQRDNQWVEQFRDDSRECAYRGF